MEQYKDLLKITMSDSSYQIWSYVRGNNYWTIHHWIFVLQNHSYSWYQKMNPNCKNLIHIHQTKINSLKKESCFNKQWNSNNIQLNVAFDPYITLYTSINFSWIKQQMLLWLQKAKKEHNDIFKPAVEQSVIHYSGREKGYQN